MIEYNILKIEPNTIVDGEGLRTSIYFAGCSLHCKGCHNPESWNFDGGTKYSKEKLISELKEIGTYKVTLTGGNPIEQLNITPLCKELKLLGFNIWLYSGYTLGEIRNSPSKKEILDYVDVIVDGRFEESLRDTSLKFRGSSNQKIWRKQDNLWILSD